MLVYWLGLSIQLMVLAMITPLFWVAATVIAVVAGFAWRHQRTRSQAAIKISELRWRLEFCVLLVLPVALLLLCEACSPKVPGPTVLPSQVPDCGGFLPVLEFVPYVQLVIAALLVWRHRARLRRSAAVGFLGAWWGIGTYLMTGMMITGTWL